MKIGTLLTIAIASLSAVGGGLAVYVAATKYETMDKVANAQGRLELVRAVGDIPRYLNPERGFATNILFGPAVVDPKTRAELDKLPQADRRRRRQDGPDPEHIDRRARRRRRDRRPRSTTLKTQFKALRAAIDKAIDGPAEARRDAAKKIVADNSVFNGAVTALLAEQVRKMAALNGDAYRQATYANIAWTLRDVGGLNASLHKNLVGANRVGDRGRAHRHRAARRAPTDQILASLHGTARQSGDAGQCRGGARQDAGSLCRSLRQGIEAGQGRRRQRQIRA